VSEQHRVNQLNFKQLEIFSKTVEAGSTTRSAVMLGMSQPAVSRNLAQLEKALGFALFERTGGRLVPTTAALRLHKEAERAIKAVQNVVDSAIGYDSENVSGQLRIAAIPSISHSFLVRVLKSFMAKYPEVTFSFATQSSRAVMETMAGRNADIGLVSMPMSHPGVQTETFIQPRSVCLMPEDHPLTAKQQISISDLIGQDLISLSRQHASRHRLEELFAMEGQKPEIKLETSTAEMSCRMVQEGLGLAIINEVTASAFMNGLVSRSFKNDMHYTYAFAFAANQPRSELAQLFVSYLKQQAAEGFGL